MHATLTVPSCALSETETERLQEALSRLARGDDGVRLVPQGTGGWVRIAQTFNALAEHHMKQSQALASLSRVAGQEGLLALQEQARQVALTSKYKSEFLANMSHELRTPLNSLLILSEQLSRNSEGNLSARQIEFARTIHSSGNDLLMLINDILDLSKIESGTVVLDMRELRLSDLQRHVERNFRHVAEARALDFQVDCRLRPTVAMRTDIQRLQQILKNLLSNAFKFTLHGQVRLEIREVREGWTPGHPQLSRARRVMAFAVSDTGIGIPGDKQQIIFDAFQQADGSTSRKYGGTGLGLAISRELSRLLGGEIRLASLPGQGSTFTLYLPLRAGVRRRASRLEPEPGSAAARRVQAGPAQARSPRKPPVRGRREAGMQSGEGEEGASNADGLLPPDDRDRLRTFDAVLLIAHADLDGARLLLAAARARGFKALVTRSGAGALALASQRPPSALVLGPALTDMASRRLLARFKHDPGLRHIPVCGIGAAEAGQDAGFPWRDLVATLPGSLEREAVEATLERLRAYGMRRQRRILVALKDLALQRDFLAGIEDDLIQATVVRRAERAAAMLRRDAFDAVVMDAGIARSACPALQAALQDMTPRSPHGLAGPLPVVLFAAPSGTPAASCVPDAGAALGQGLREVGSLVPLVEMTLRLLHHPVQRLPEERRAMLQGLIEQACPLAGRRVLIVDDDMRNIFALATILEDQGMDIVWADNGHEAIHRVATDPQIGVVLMDIMMPELDGLATMREIRRLPCGRELALIAVTAKAMKGDREKCIDAGAWDYLSKPVNPHELLTALRAWLTP